MSNRAVAIIPVRSADIAPGGTMIVLAGRPLLAYTIDAAKAARKVGRVVVSTDGEQVAGLARELGADAPFVRPPALAAKGVTLATVLQHALRFLEDGGDRPEVVVTLEASHPVRPDGIVDQVLDALIGSDLDTVFAAYEDHHAFWTLAEDGGFQPVGNAVEQTRASRRPLFRELAGLVSASRADVVRAGQRIGRNVGVVPIRDWTGLVDTQDPMGLDLAELLLTRAAGRRRS